MRIFRPKVRSSSAPANGGVCAFSSLRPEGTRSRSASLQDAKLDRSYPGRWPGLRKSGPSALKNKPADPGNTILHGIAWKGDGNASGQRFRHSSGVPFLLLAFRGRVASPHYHPPPLRGSSTRMNSLPGFLTSYRGCERQPNPGTYFGPVPKMGNGERSR